MGNIFYKLSGGKINPLMVPQGFCSSNGSSCSQVVGQKKKNFLLMHAMGPNVAGVIGSAVAAGVLLSMFG